MAKQLNVNLNFTADTRQAAAQIQNLQRQLTQLVSQPVSIGQSLTEDIAKATHAAAELKIHLQNATNVNTGTLDFGKLNQSLKASKVSLNDYAAQLQKLGPQGQQAFMELARSVANAEIPLKRSNTLLSQFATTLANTARWQISSSILHGFMGAVSKAWGYSKDLNESLNNIRIVTNKNVDEMARFADQANRAAKALSTTTTQYTNASLIYYQQGLSDEEVLGRTETTIKLANTSRQSAEIVSDQMTAIWNNFYDGSKTLEYYADVVAALGAETASSSEEIAQGLEKFAAVADTVGLSYEYATSALATVTAKTRQSADVVGTAFKTLFARIQDLELGETLDDGTTLGTYSEALEKVGINIKDDNNELKRMDDILNEMGAKWQAIDKDQQVALAKSVAGIRQYTQLIALMDNWDFMQENLDTARNAAGTLEEQADIYAESWEAASSRVQASLENIYASIMDDEFFIDLTDGFAGLIDTVGGFIKSIGGLQGVLSTLGFVVTKIFAKEMAAGFERLAYNIQMSTEAGRKSVWNAKKEQMQSFSQQMTQNYDTSTLVGKTSKSVYQEELNLQQQLVEKAQEMTVEEQKKYQLLLQQHQVMGEQTIELAKQAEQAKLQRSDSQVQLMGLAAQQPRANNRQVALDRSRGVGEQISQTNILLREMSNSTQISEEQLKKLELQLGNLRIGPRIIKELKENLTGAAVGSEEFDNAIVEIQMHLQSAQQGAEQFIASLLGVQQGDDAYDELIASINRYINDSAVAEERQYNLNTSIKNGKSATKEFEQGLDEVGKKTKTTSQLLTSMTSGMMAVGMLASSISGIIDTINNPDASGWERFASILTSVSMVAMSLSGVFTGIKAGWDLVSSGALKNTAITVANTIAQHMNEKALEKKNKEAAKSVVVTKLDSETTKEATEENVKKTVSEKAETEVLEEQNKEKAKGIILDKAGNGTGSGGKNPIPTKGGGGTKLTSLEPGALKSVGKFAGGIALIAAAVALAAITINAAVDQFNRFETAAKDAATAAELASKAYDEAKESYSTFTSTTSEYDNIVTSMEEMTKGTVEYTEAMMKANDEALKLIENYEGLQYTTKDGLITIDEESLKKVQQEELEKMSKAQSSSLLANVAAKQARGEADKVNVAREIDTSGDYAWYAANTGVSTAAGVGVGLMGGIGASMLSGALTASVAGPIGAAIGAAVGLIAGIAVSAIQGAQTEAEANAVDNVVEYVRKNGTDIFAAKTSEEFGQMLKDANLEIDDQDLVEALFNNSQSVDNNTESLEEFAMKEAERRNQADEQWKLAYGAYNTGNEIYDQAASQVFLQNEALKYKDEHPEIMKSIAEEVDELFSGSNDDLWKAYMEEVLGDTNIDEDSTTGDKYKIEDLGGDYVTLKMKNDQGTYETIGDEDGLSEEAAKQQLINARIMKKVAENLGGDNQRLNALVDQLKRAGVEDTIMANDILEAFSDKNGKAIDLSKFAPELIDQITTSAIADSGLRTKVEKALEDYKKQLPEWWGELNDKEKSMLFEIGIDKEQSLDEVRRALVAMQNYLDGTSLSTSINVADQLESALKNNDWKKLQELFKSEDGPGENKWAEFMGLGSLEEMEDYIKKWRLGLLNDGERLTEEIIADNKSKYNAAVGSIISTQKSLKVAQENRDKFYEENNVQNIKDSRTQYETSISKAINDAVGTNASNYKNVSDYANAVLNKLKNTEGNFDENNSFIKLFEELKKGKNANIVDVLKLLEESTGVTYDPAVRQKLIYQHGGALHTGGTPDLVVDLIGKNADKIKSDLANSNSTYQQGYGQETDQTLDKAKDLDDSVNDLSTKKQKLKDSVKVGTDKDNPTILDSLIASQQAERDIERANQEEDARLGLDTETVQSYQEVIQNLSATGDTFDGISDELDKDSNSARKAARELGRLNNAVDAIASNYESWIELLESDDLLEKIKQSKELDAAYSDLLDMDTGTLSQDFLLDPDNLRLATEAAKGNIEDYNQLQINASKDIIKDLGNDAAELENTIQEIANKDDIDIGKKFTIIDSPGREIEGEEIGKKIYDMYLKAYEAALKGGKSVSEAMRMANDLIAAQGFNFDITKDTELKTIYTNVEAPPNVTPQLDGIVTGIDGMPISGLSWSLESSDDYKYELGTFIVPKGATITKSVENYGTSASAFEKKAKKSEPTKTKDLRTKKSDMVERYKEINDQLAETQHLINKNLTLAEGLWGQARIDKLRENINLMKQENQQLKEKQRLNKLYLSEDRNLLNEAAKEADVSFAFDEEGKIINFTKQMEGLYAQRQSMLDDFGEYTSEEQKKQLDEFDKKIDKLKEAYDAYESSLDEQMSLEEERQEKLLQIQTEYFNALNESLEIEISINEDDMETIEYYIGKMSDDFYRMAEAGALMISSQNDLGVSQLDIYKDNLAWQAQHYNKLANAHATVDPATGKTLINDADFIKGLREVKSSIIDNLNSLNELDESMLNYYGDTIAMAQEELVKYTDKMEHSNSVLEHYKTILELTGKQTNYKALGVVLENQAKLAEQRVKVSKANLELYNDQVNERYAEWQKAIVAKDAAAAELYKKQYEAALQAAQEAEEEYLSNAEVWGESLRAVFENTMSGLAQDLENTLTGGTSFDQLSTSMERASSLQEEYLTTTNKIYETNKLMRSVQQEIDKSTNSVAKRKMKQFIEETKEMQDQNKLSQFELDIQKAKYDLLLAEIALEEAQNAKSTVRLQRDSEGNFGYVYTADQNAVSAAEQELADKQNALYNIGLEGANNYSQKYQQTLSEMYDAISELQQQKNEGLFESEEEYQNAVLAAKEYYYEKLEQYSFLYAEALTTDSAVVEEAWSSDFNSMINQTENWKDAVDNYLQQVEKEFKDYEKQLDTIANETTGLDLKDLADKTKDITEASEDLVEQILDPDKGVINAIESQISSVANLTGSYATLRKEIQDLIKSYESMVKKLNDKPEDINDGKGTSEQREQEFNKQNSNNSNKTSSSGSNNSGNSSSGGNLSIGERVEVEPGTRWYNDSYGNGPSGLARGGSIKYINTKGSYAYNIEGLGWVKKDDIVGYDTGGYTGDWSGSYGKLAMLHKKEMILNQQDTQNLLMSIEVMERILDTIDLHSAFSQLGNGLVSPQYVEPSNKTVEQHVEIEANFPNVTNHSEIEEAFNNIINLASQYANR